MIITCTGSLGEEERYVSPGMGQKVNKLKQYCVQALLPSFEKHLIYRNLTNSRSETELLTNSGLKQITQQVTQIKQHTIVYLRFTDKHYIFFMQSILQQN